MKRNTKWYGILFLLIVIISITTMTTIQNKEGFLNGLFGGGGGGGGGSSCDIVCQALKAAEEERKRQERLEEIARQKRECINSGGAWDGSNCHKYKNFPSNVFKRKYVKPRPPNLTFCEKYEEEPSLLKSECLKKDKNSCNNECCKWCESKNKCVPYIANITEINTMDYLECN